MGKNRNNRRRNSYKVLPQQNTAFITSAYRNTDTYIFIVERMKNIWLDRIVYENVPDTIDIPTISNGFLYNGHVCYFNDMIMGNLCMTGVLQGSEDVYGYNREYHVHAPNGYEKTLLVSRFSQNRDGVVIFDNYSHSIPINGIYYYADKLYEPLRGADVNVGLQKSPNIIRTSENLRLTVENILEKAEGGQSRIIVDKDLDLDTVQNVDLTVPFVADKLWTYTTNVWNDFLTWCGIENATNQKKERLVSDEVNANYGNVEIERKTALNSRIEGFTAVNKLFGTNIQVRFNSDLLTKLNNPVGEEMSSHGNIYNADTRDSANVDT